MLSIGPALGLVVVATSSLASRIHDSTNQSTLPPSSKIFVHQRSLLQAVDVHTNNQDPSKVGKTTKTVVHQKVAGNGYKPGSPLYNLQEGKADAPASTKKAAEPQNGTREEKLNACIDDALDRHLKGDTIYTGEFEKDTNDCMLKYDATIWERIEIQHKVHNTLFKEHFWHYLAVGAAFFVLTLIAAFVYSRNKKDPDPIRRGMAMNRDEFTFGVCSCFEVPSMSLLTCCCFAVRWADTMRMASLLSFWVGVIMLTLLELINGITGGLAMCCAWGVVVYYRQQLRKEFNLESGTLQSCCCDICGYCWIPCCMAVQEARQLEEAYAVGHPIRKVHAGA